MMNEKEANIFVLSQVTKELNQAREHSHKVQLSVKEQKEKEIKAAEAIRADYERELTVKLAMIDLEKSQLANKIVAYEKQ